MDTKKQVVMDIILSVCVCVRERERERERDRQAGRGSERKRERGTGLKCCTFLSSSNGMDIMSQPGYRKLVT